MYLNMIVLVVLSAFLFSLSLSLSLYIYTRIIIISPKSTSYQLLRPFKGTPVLYREPDRERTGLPGSWAPQRKDRALEVRRTAPQRPRPLGTPQVPLKESFKSGYIDIGIDIGIGIYIYIYIYIDMRGSQKRIHLRVL